MALDIDIHKNILVSILKDIFSDTQLAPYLAFKGGTAALLFYDLSRFSVDLDFDLLQDSYADSAFERIKMILEGYGNIKESQKKRNGQIFLLSYHNKHEGADNVKVEINLRNFGSKYEIKRYLGIAMRVMVEEDMAAHKLVAMYERMGRANRDIYDVWFFLKNNWPVNKIIVEERTGMSYRAFLKVSIEKLEKLEGKHILSGLGELLTEKQKVWCKAKLISETIFLLRLALSNEQI